MKLPTIADQDPWLEPYRDTLEYQQAYLRQAERRLLDGSPLESFALGHLYFGLHRNKQSWLFREWAPNAAAIYLLCEHHDWQDDLAYSLKFGKNGVWELQLPVGALAHGDHYKLRVYWDGGSSERIPSYATI